MLQTCLNFLKKVDYNKTFYESKTIIESEAKNHNWIELDPSSKL